MKINARLFLPVLLAAGLFTACSDDDDVIVDTEAPAITINEPHDDDEVAPGEELHFEAVFTDNVELGSYKIEIHDDFDDHDHAVKSSHDVNPFHYEQDFTIPEGGTSFDAVHHIEIPTELDGAPLSEGAYHLSVFVTDAAGNQQEAFVDFEIGDEHEDEHED